MSIVNQAEKDGILYDINDARVYTVDLGTVILSEGATGSFSTTLPVEDSLSLYEAEEGIVKFTIEFQSSPGETQLVDAICRTCSKMSANGMTIVTLSNFMQADQDYYSAMVIQIISQQGASSATVQGLTIEHNFNAGSGGAKVVDFGTVDGSISDPDNPYMTTITQEKYEEALEADIAQFTTTSDDGITFRALKMQVGSGQSSILFTALESELRGLMVMVAEQNSSYTLAIGMSSRLLSSDDTINIENLNASSASDGQVITKTSNGIAWADVPAGIIDYDNLTDIPIINQDLDAVGFTPVANTYYKHVGASDTNYDIGKIYFYTGSEYKAIDGSGSSESTYELSGTVSSGDTISDTTAIDVMTAHKPIIINGKRFEYQDANGFNLRYFNASLNGAIIHLIIMEYNTDRNEVLFIEQDVNDGIVYTTTEPTAPNTNGLMKLVVLNAQPATKYAGWLYYITQ